jgi:hypothetical protein
VTQIDVAYCAGLVDGEGCIRIKKSQAYRCQGRTTPGYHATMMIRMVERAAIEFVADVLGGTIRKEKPHAKSGRAMYTWSISDAKAGAAARSILPYLRVKRRQAELILRLRDLQAESVRYRTKVTGYREFPNQHGTVRIVENRSFSDEYVGWCESMYLESRRLNRVGVAALLD